MAKSPRWKVYTGDGKYIASVTLPEYGAMILGGIGIKGTTIRDGHKKIVFTNFVDEDAGNSYDLVAQMVYDKLANKKEE